MSSCGTGLRVAVEAGREPRRGWRDVGAYAAVPPGSDAHALGTKRTKLLNRFTQTRARS